MKEYCKRCGSCCTPCISVSPQELGRYVRRNFPFIKKEEIDYVNNDYLLIYFDMTPISHEQVYKLNPYLKNYRDDNLYYYKCSHLGEDKKCKIHDRLVEGNMCDGYCWYGKMPHESFWYCKDCGYKEELDEYE
jgi:hypothetical protein